MATDRNYPLKLIVHDGLQDGMASLYTLLQEAFQTCNATLLKSILVSPGFKIETNEFYGKISGEYLVVNLGTVIFPDYSIYIPPLSASQVKMDMSDCPGSAYLNIYPTDETTHPYPIEGGAREDVMQWRGVEYRLEKDPAGSTGYTVGFLEYVEADAGTPDVSSEWVYSDMRFDSVMQLQETPYTIPSTSPMENIEIGFVRSYDYRERHIDSGGTTISLDIESPIQNVGVGALLNISWDTEINTESALGNIAYYKIELIPKGENEYPEQIIQKSFIDDGVSERVSISIPVVYQTTYLVKIYRVKDSVGQIAEGPFYNDEVYIGETSVPTGNHNLVISDVGAGGGVFIESKTDAAMDFPEYTYQVFVNEGEYIAASPVTLLHQGRYQKTAYFPAPSANYVSIITRFIHTETNAIVSSVEGGKPFNHATVSTSIENVVALNGININPRFEDDLVGDNPGMQVVIDDYTISTKWIVTRAICSVNDGSPPLQDDVDERLIRNDTTTPLAAAGQIIIKKSTGGGYDQIATFSYDDQGNGTYNPSVPLVIDDATVIRIEAGVDSTTEYSNPIGIHIVFYLLSEWQEE